MKTLECQAREFSFGCKEITKVGGTMVIVVLRGGFSGRNL